MNHGSTSSFNEVRHYVDQWRNLPNPNDWQVTPETARLLQHWRYHKFNNFRPFFAQAEAAEVAIWLTEVAPKAGKVGTKFLGHLANADNDANPDAHGAEAGHRRGQDDGHGDADCVADRQRGTATGQ